MSFWLDNVWEPPKVKTCQGIGKGAKCGKAAPIKLSSNKWNAKTEELEEIEVYVCPEHAAELRTAMQKDRRVITDDHTAPPELKGKKFEDSL